MFQGHHVFSLPQPWNQPVLQWSSVPFGGKQNSDVIPGNRSGIATDVPLFVGHLSRDAGWRHPCLSGFIAFLLLASYCDVQRWLSLDPVSSVPLNWLVTSFPAVRTWLLCPHWVICWLECTEGSLLTHGTWGSTLINWEVNIHLQYCLRQTVYTEMHKSQLPVYAIQKQPTGLLSVLWGNNCSYECFVPFTYMALSLG